MTGKEKHIITTFIRSLYRLLLSLLCRITATKRLFPPLGGRLGGGLLLLSVTAMAQSPVPIPNPAWPLDSVINGSVHKFTVQGDRNYDQPSRFVWNVDGGRLFFEEELTNLAGNGTTDTVPGDANNVTTMWVVWDSFSTPLDTGYVYVHEISAAGCERFPDDPGKYQGMRIKVSAPPDVLFAKTNSQTCSYSDGINVPVYIDGMPPFKLVYEINGNEQEPWYIEEEDLLYKGDSAYVNILIDDYVGVNEDSDFEYYIELTEVSSGGIEGEILQPYHAVNVHRRPDPSVIWPGRQQITLGEDHVVNLQYSGESAETYLWDIYHTDSNELVYSEETGAEAYNRITFDFEPGAGNYYILSSYIAENGCISLPDTFEIEIFDAPVITFTGDGYIGCSESSLVPAEVIEFGIEYRGALTYSFTYAIYDYNGNQVDTGTLEDIDQNEFTLDIENTFINDAQPQQDREWKIVILANTAENEEKVGITVEDGERTITIHPKPVVYEDIDFAN